MLKEVKYNGYSAVPSDYECQDGDLAAVMGLVQEKGALRPIANPKPILSYAGSILFVHTTSKFTHYIGYSDGTPPRANMQWIDSESPTTVHSFSKPESTMLRDAIIQINAIGNTLVVLTTIGMYYYLWKGDEQTYVRLGNHIPELPIRFGLQGTFLNNDDETSYIELSHPLSLNTHYELDEEDIPNATTAVLAQANKFIAKFATNEGRFAAPFFVRYAFRLFDGSLVMHSAPVYMDVLNGANPIVYGDSYAVSSGKATSLQARARGIVCDLDYNVLSSSMLSALRDWGDIVKSVDIFVSAPIYKYKQDGENVKEIVTESDSRNWCKSVCKMMNPRESYASVITKYQEFPIYYLSSWSEGGGTVHPTKHWVLPTYSDEEFFERVKGCSTFYLLTSIPLDRLSTAITKIDVSTEYLQSLVAREAMTDDYDSHTSLIPRYSFPYNSRLNLCDMTKELFRGFWSGSAIQRTDGHIVAVHEMPSDDADGTESLRVYVSLKKDGNTVVVVEESSSVHGLFSPIDYYYYPDVDAFEAVFAFTDEEDNTTYYRVPLEPHSGLNGAIFYSNGASVKDVGAQVSSAPTVSSDRTVEIRNKVYTSEVNNPFAFPLLGINTVGTGRIVGLATAAKALSQGQFGQFPMYAFSTDGVWALEVSATTGAFSARQPITRDVCINVDSITQIDSAVLFASDRGIMLLSGSNTQCITEGIDNNGEPFNFAAMPLAGDIKTLLGVTAGESDELTEKAFRTFLLGCQMLYAYDRQLIIVFNPDYPYAYVYSLESKSWGVMKSGIQAKVLSYPEAFAVMEDGALFDFSKEAGVPVRQFLLTRPLKLDQGAKDVLKTVDTVIQRGDFAKGHVQSILYGSRDLRNWFPVFTSTDHYLRGFRGTPYKYFRIGLVCSLTSGESIWGATIQFTPRLTDQPR